MAKLPVVVKQAGQTPGGRSKLCTSFLAACAACLCLLVLLYAHARLHLGRVQPRHRAQQVRLLKDYANSEEGLSGVFVDGETRVAGARAAVERSPALRPGEVWRDSDGQFIQAHGGSVLEHAGTYYWFGEHKGGSTYFSHTLAYSTPRVDFIGIACYSSVDLMTWHNQGLALRAGAHAELHPSRVAERPRVLYNNGTRAFVMWLHVDEADYELARVGIAVSHQPQADYEPARVGIAVSHQPQGPYEYLGSFRPHGQQARDLTVFQDEDGSAYLAYSSENNMVMHVGRLTADYLAPEPYYRRVMVDRKREAPAIFKHRGWYLMLTSGCQGWDPSAAEVFVTRDMLGEWRSIGNPCTGGTAVDRALTYFSQATHVIPIWQHPGSFVMMADIWNPADLGSSRYLWLPMWAMELSEEAQALAGQRVQGRGELPFQGDSVQLPARLPVAGVDVVVRWMYAWTPQDLALPAVSRFVMP